MTKNELARIIAQKHNITIKASEDVITGVFDEIVEAAMSGDPYQHFGFGKFVISARSERKIHDVNTGDHRILPETKILRLSTSRRLNRRINGEE